MLITPPNLVQFTEEDGIPDPTPEALLERDMCNHSDPDSGLVCTRPHHRDDIHVAGAGDYLAGVFTAPAFDPDLNVRATLTTIGYQLNAALDALDDENEGDLRNAVLNIASKADALRAWVKGA